MAEHRIILVLEGTEQDEGHVRLDVFLSELQKLRSSLSKVDESLLDGTRNTDFAVVGLSHSSPATVELEARRIPGRRDVRSQLSRYMTTLMRGIETGKIPTGIDSSLLADLKGLAAPVGVLLKSATVSIGEGVFDLSGSFVRHIDEHIASQETCIGTIEGMLEKINVHSDANMFTIFPDVGPKRVACHFPPELMEVAVSSIKRRVAVTGTMRYQKHEAFPYHVEVSHIKAYPPEAQLPSLEQLRGLAPEATGDKSSEQFIGELRDACQ
jgi:hypothetical protein